MTQTMTADEIEAELQKFISEGTKLEEFAQELTQQMVRKIFYTFYSLGHDSIEDAFDYLKEMTEYSFDKIEENINRLEDPYLKEAKALAKVRLKS